MPFIYGHVSAFSHPTLVKAARREIDREINSLREADGIRALQSRRNSLSAIARLPTELLEEIFRHCALPADHKPEENYRLPHHLITASYVCSLWRSVACGCPDLWSRIPFVTVKTLKWAREMLLRSKAASLIIRAVLDEYSFRHFDVVLAHISRTTELHITIKFAKVQDVFHKLTTAAPVLRCLSLTYEPYVFFGERTTRVPVLFNGETPRLSHLALHCCAVQWGSPLLSGLIHLIVRTVDNRPTMSELLDTLEALPHLKTLSLVGALPLASNTTSTPQRTSAVSLPSLQFLRLDGSPLECLQAMSHLRFPQTVSLALDFLFAGPLNMSHTGTPLVSSIVDCIRDWAYPIQFKTVSVRMTPGVFCRAAFQLEAWADEFDVFESALKPSRLNISLHGGSNFVLKQMMISLSRAMSWTHVENLRWMVESDDLQWISWLGILKEASSLRTVHMTHNPARLVSALGDKHVEGATTEDLQNVGQLEGGVAEGRILLSRRPVFLWPRLETLSLSQIDFAKVYKPLRRRFFDILLASLHCRYQFERGVQKVHVQKFANFTEHEARKLGYVGAEVTWNRINKRMRDEETLEEEETEGDETEDEETEDGETEDMHRQG